MPGDPFAPPPRPAVRGVVVGVLGLLAVAPVIASTPPSTVHVQEYSATGVDWVEFAVFHCRSNPAPVSLSLPWAAAVAITLAGAAGVAAWRLAPTIRRWTIAALVVTVVGSLGARVLLADSLRKKLAACERKLDDAAPASSAPCGCPPDDPLCSCL